MVNFNMVGVVCCCGCISSKFISNRVKDNLWLVIGLLLFSNVKL